MAVERSYARLGLFLVVVLVVVLATALLFIQRWRSRAVIEMVTYTSENVSGLEVSSPVRYRGVPVGRVSRGARGPACEHHRDRLRGVPRSPQHHWRERRADPATGGYRRHVPQASRPGGGKPRDRRGVPAARCAGEPAAADRRSASRPTGRTSRRCPRRWRRCGIGCRKSWSARKPRCRCSGRSSPGFPTASTGATDSSPTSSASFRRASCRR